MFERSIISFRLVLFTSTVSTTLGQTFTRENLAASLADEQTRKAAVSFVVDSGRAYIPLLMSWRETPPANVRVGQLFVGMADVFGELKIVDAVPFLIKHIDIERAQVRLGSPWEKGPAVVEARLPAVAALIKIGSPSADALYRASWRMAGHDRLAALYVVARVGDPAEAREFLKGVMSELDFERQWVQEDVKIVNDRH